MLYRTDEGGHTELDAETKKKISIYVPCYNEVGNVKSMAVTGGAGLTY